MNRDLRATFADPPREFGIMPFWFLNDDLEEEEIVRQIREMHAKGFGGFIPHARVGLSRRVGYLTDEWFRLMRVAAAEAERLGMKVVLYDEGSYPSGSAAGRVVAENPAFAAKCIVPLTKDVDGPATGYWRPNRSRFMQDRILCVVQARLTGENAIDPATAAVLPMDESGGEVVRYDVPEGSWRLMAVLECYSGGIIRGVHDEEDEGHALAPAAGNIMDPDSVACFIRHTHDQYYKHLKEWFGTTVVAMFTDEPNPLGRGPKRGPRPWPFAEGFVEDLSNYWREDVPTWLPALWTDYGPRTEEFRAKYSRAYHDRIEWIFYGAQSGWCADHGIALTGHPEQSNEMGGLKYFQWPGQDMVWRYIEPGNESGVSGPHSAAAKAATSAAVLHKRRRIASEALGAYGWRLTLDEAKWVTDWHMVRGNNLFFLHAMFYSIRGRRAYESEPDLGMHNAWWPYFQVLGDYTRRVCALLTDGELVCDVAVLSDPNSLRWDAARELLENQIDFCYVDDAAVRHGTPADGRMVIGGGSFRAVVCDPQTVDEATGDALADFERAGGTVVRAWEPGRLAPRLAAALGKDVEWPAPGGGSHAGLRALHYRNGGRDLYFLTNEGESAIEGELSLATVGALELWDPMTGRVLPWPAAASDGRLQTRLRLEPRQGLVLAVDPHGTPDPAAATVPVPDEVITEISGPWAATTLSGEPSPAPCPGDWTTVRELETFSGTLCFSTVFEVNKTHLQAPLFLDLGSVGDIAEVFVNGERAGVLAWGPRAVEIGGLCTNGTNSVEVRVTNSKANRMEGLMMPSGLLGPVTLRRGRLL